MRVAPFLAAAILVLAFVLLVRAEALDAPRTGLEETPARGDVRDR